MFFFESVPGQNLVYYDSLFSEYPGLPDMKQNGTQTQHAAAMEASEPTEIVLDPIHPEQRWPLWAKAP